MLLRVSGKKSGENFDISGIATSDRLATGVANEALLNNFTEAAVRMDEPALTLARDALELELGTAALVDAAGVIGNFQRMNRIADGCGIALDDAFAAMTIELRRELDIDGFMSAANTK